MGRKKKELVQEVAVQYANRDAAVKAFEGIYALIKDLSKEEKDWIICSLDVLFEDVTLK